MRIFAPLFALALTLASAPAHADLKLLMIEQQGCPYCTLWENEIGPIYPKTPEAQVAPLEHVNLRKPFPEDLQLRSRPQFTPTFILVRDGVELSRIQGYPGQDFFWGLLNKMLEEQPEWQNRPPSDPEG